MSKIADIIHFFGYDIYKIPTRYDFLGLEKMGIKTIIDIGANRGQFARRAYTAFPGAEFFCFEPIKKAFDDLEVWAKDKKVHCFNIALGNKEGEVKMHLHSNHEESSSMLKISKKYEEIHSSELTKNQEIISVAEKTLDQFVREKNFYFEKEILVKIDVQGYERQVVEGGKGTISLAKACILPAGNDLLYEGQPNFKEIFILMDSLGFRYLANLIQARAKDGHIVYSDLIFIK